MHTRTHVGGTRKLGQQGLSLTWLEHGCFRSTDAALHEELGGACVNSKYRFVTPWPSIWFVNGYTGSADEQVRGVSMQQQKTLQVFKSSWTEVLNNAEGCVEGTSGFKESCRTVPCLSS